MGLLGSANGKTPFYSAGDTTPGSGRSPGLGSGNPLQYTCLENSMNRSLMGYSLWGCKELDRTENTVHTLKTAIKAAM